MVNAKFFKSQEISRGEDMKNHIINTFGMKTDAGEFYLSIHNGKIWAKHNYIGRWHEYGSSPKAHAENYAKIADHFHLHTA